MKTTQRRLILKILGIITICAVDILWSTFFIYTWKKQDLTLSVRNASDDLLGIVKQNMIVFAVPFLLLFIVFLVLRKCFTTEMYMKISNPKQRNIMMVLIGILMIITIFALIMKEDKVTILYNLFYYVVFIAFTEEFVVRDVCVYLIRDEEKYVRYLVPNVLFAAMHLFAYAGWNEITGSYILSFITSQMPGLVVMGCLFQYLKEKSGTIWVPVLVHAIMDYSTVLGYH